MKACIIQPYYSFDGNDLDRCFAGMLDLLETCDETLDLIVLPEYCDVPAATQNAAQFHASVAKYNAVIAEKAAETAKRCHAILFANYADCTETGLRNTTFAFDREGNLVGKYYKAHPAPSEVKTAAEGGNELDCSYSYSYEKPYTLDIEGLRFGFMTCYDFYMYEEYAALARQNVDIIIGCSHQRTDPHDALELFGRFLCYNTNAYLVRSAVSLGKDSPVCGCSMIVSPRGEMLADMKNEVGTAVCEFDPHDKYYKPAGFRGTPKAHYEYIDEGRRPWLYRPGGSMMIPGDRYLPYPRICAHRGFPAAAPESSPAGFGAAVALGAQEIEFDLYSTRDGVLVINHDGVFDRGNGMESIRDTDFADLRTVNFSDQHYDCDYHNREVFRGTQIMTFEELLKRFSNTVIMNIHVKLWDLGCPEPMYEEIAALIRKYDCAKHVYMMSTSDKCLAEFHKIAPEIARCVGYDGIHDDPLRMVKRALALGCQKVQLFKPYFTQETIDFARANGIRCNVFWADDPEEACRYLDMGIDTILTNNYFAVAQACEAHLKERGE